LNRHRYHNPKQVRRETPVALFFFQQLESENNTSVQVQYGLRDEDLDCNHEMEDMVDSSEGEESMDEDAFENFMNIDDDI
jgi:hypothetical protein